MDFASETAAALADLCEANALMMRALALLDRHDHVAGVYLDQAIANLGLRTSAAETAIWP